MQTFEGNKKLTIEEDNKILYLDTDIIITGDINKVFELINTDVLKYDIMKYV